MNHNHSEELLNRNGIDYNVEEVEERLYPERSSQVGFLGENECLVQVIEDDRTLLEIIGIDYDTLLRHIYIMTGRITHGDDCSIKEYLAIIRGFSTFEPNNLDSQECPWGDDREGGIRTTNIMKEPSKLKVGAHGLTISGLHPHLIKHHHFFEGRGTFYRLDPLTYIFYCNIQSPTLEHREIADMFYESLRGRLSAPVNHQDFWSAANSIPMLENHPSYRELVEYGIKIFEESEHPNKQAMLSFLKSCDV